MQVRDGRKKRVGGENLNFPFGFDLMYELRDPRLTWGGIISIFMIDVPESTN